MGRTGEGAPSPPQSESEAEDLGPKLSSTISSRRSRFRRTSTSAYGQSATEAARSIRAIKDFQDIPWIIPQERPIELIFFQKVFRQLLKAMGSKMKGRAGVNNTAADDAAMSVPILVLQRAMMRLFRILREENSFASWDAKRYDLNGDGSVGWWEFCQIWFELRPSVKLSPMERIYLTFEDPGQSKVGKLVSTVVMLAIFVSMGSFVMSTMPNMKDPPECAGCEPEAFEVFTTIDTVCVVLFSIEYIIRMVAYTFTRAPLVTQDELVKCMCSDEITPPRSKPIRMLGFILSPANVIDISAILPTYTNWFLQATGGSHGSSPFVKFTRLMRIGRAFRLGRRFEAIIIVGRSVERSKRALWVLVLNIVMGMLVFGTVMYYLEQGEYIPETGMYKRIPGAGYDDDWDRTPFESIPHAFWWAIVTSCTIGYGDVYPTSDLGKTVAGGAMVWSLCVLALPIGVIGSNFEMIWEEFDKEKATEIRMKSLTGQVTRATILSLQPLAHSRMAKFEVWHDTCMGDGNDLYLGEIETELEINPTAKQKVVEHLSLSLVTDKSRTSRVGQGTLEVEYTWEPDSPWSETDLRDPGTLLKGTLTVTILSCSQLPALDWKGSGISDPYVRVTLFPNSPGLDGVIVPMALRTGSVFDMEDAEWNEALSFQFHWHRDGVAAKRELERSKAQVRGAQVVACSPFADASHPASPSQPSSPSNGEDRSLSDDTRLPSALLALSSDVSELHSVLPLLLQEVGELQEGVRLILSALNVDVALEDSCQADVHTSTLAAGSSLDPEISRSPLPPFISADMQPPEDRWRPPGVHHGSDSWSVPGAVPDELSEAVVSRIEVSPSRSLLRAD
mmetsp:Transcript_50980/g.150268  ORF Transcript_50980/g.150268 Transcript_50980/m.150268 type:complete len:846 (-) Transcript_50980:21-2558(-)